MRNANVSLKQVKWAVACSLAEFILKADYVLMLVRDDGSLELQTRFPRGYDPGPDAACLSLLAGRIIVPDVESSSELDELMNGFSSDYEEHLRELVFDKIYPAFDAVPAEIHETLQRTLNEHGFIKFNRMEVQ